MSHGAAPTHPVPDRAVRTMKLRRSLPHMSASAMASVVKYAQDHDLSDLPSSTRGIRRDRDTTLEDTPFGPMLISTSLVGKAGSKDLVLHMINPLGYLHTAVKQPGSGFSKRFIELWNSKPSTVDNPWRIILYADEVVPGNALSLMNKRKVWIVYFSFVEFGAQLSDEDAWAPLAAEPSVGLKHVCAGISQAVAAVIKQFFGARTFDLRKSGILLHRPDGSTFRFFASFDMMLQDGGAHKLIWGCKGDAGTRVCMLCKNLVSEQSGLVDTDGTHRLVCSSMFRSELRLATNADIRGAIDRVAAFRLTDSAADFKLRQQAIGFTYEQHGLLNDPALRNVIYPATQYCHDWMHGMCANGVGNIVMFMSLSGISIEPPDIWTRLSHYLALYVWPAVTKFKAENAEVFNAQRVSAYKKGQAIKCSASELLSILPVTLLYVTMSVKPTGLCQAECAALEALGDLFEAFMATPLGVIEPDYLQSRVHALMRCCVNAGWRQFMTPKFHWLHHYADHLRRWGLLPTCWAHERKHRMAKRYATDITNRRSYSKSVLSEIISHQLTSIAEPETLDKSVRLLDPIAARKQLADFVCQELDAPPGIPVKSSLRALLSTTQVCTRHDIVLFRSEDGVNFVAGKVAHLCSVNSVVFAIIMKWQLQSADLARGYACWRIVDDALFVTVQSILASVIWTECQSGIARTLVPFQFRGLSAVNV